MRKWLLRRWGAGLVSVTVRFPEAFALALRDRTVSATKEYRSQTGQKQSKRKVGKAAILMLSMDADQELREQTEYYDKLLAKKSPRRKKT